MQQTTQERKTRRAAPAQRATAQQTPARMNPFNLLFILDCTASMEPFVEGIIRALQRVLDTIMEGNYNPHLGLIIFRDELEGEMPVVHPLGTAPEEMKKILEAVETIGGGTAPESGLPAIALALDELAKADPNLKRVFLHISDAPLHDPESGHTAASIKAALQQHKVRFFACTPVIEPYKTFANATGGQLFPIEPNMDAEAFADVLVSFAKTTVALMGNEPEMTDEMRALLDKAR